PGFGPTLTSELLSWRQGLERRFVYDPREQLNPTEVAALRAKLASRKRDLETRLRSAVTNLGQAANYARDLRGTLSTSCQHAFHQLKQAELDEKQTTGIFYKPAKILSSFCVVLGLLTLGVAGTPQRSIAMHDNRGLPNPPSSAPS